MTFNAIAQSTLLNILNQGPSRIEPEVQPVIPAQLFPSHTFVIGDIHPAADHGPIIPENLVAKGHATGKSRRTVLWEQTLPGVNARLLIQQLHKQQAVRVESLYRTTNRQLFWKIYIEHVYTLSTRDTSQIQYRVFRQ